MTVVQSVRDARNDRDAHTHVRTQQRSRSTNDTYAPKRGSDGRCEPVPGCHCCLLAASASVRQVGGVGQRVVKPATLQLQRSADAFADAVLSSKKEENVAT